jgi:Tol biopolymer transport system component
VSERGGISRDRPWLRAWLVVGLAAWAEIGVVLIDRANRQGHVGDILVSPYHLVGYAALITLGVYSAKAFFPALRHGKWRRAFPPFYGGVGLSFVMLLAFFPLSIVWRGVVGQPRGIENGIAPVALLVPSALVVLAIGPVREALASRHDPGAGLGQRRVRWAGVVAAGLVGGALTFQPFEPIREPLSDFAVNGGRDVSEIWSMAPDGSAQARLVTALGDGIDYSGPVWSPDSRRIAYTTWTNNGGVAQNLRNEDQTAAVWTMAADGTDRRLLVDGAPGLAWIPAWSPDGEWIAYTVSPKGPSANAAGAAPEPQPVPAGIGPPSAMSGASIWLIRPDGTDAHRLSPEGSDAVGAAWSPNGTRLAYGVSDATGNGDIYVATVTDSGMTDEHVLAPSPGNEWGATWSPDGTHIVFTSNRTGDDEVWMVAVDSDDGDPRQLTDNATGDWVAAYAPDGSRIVFVSDRSGDPEIWSMATDGSDPRNLSNHPLASDGQWGVAWSPDGSRLVFAESAFQDAASSGWVREDLAAAQYVVFAAVLAIVALLLVAIRARIGSYTVALAIVVGLAATSTDQWRFLPAAVIGGILVDVVVGSVRPALRPRVAAAGLPAAAVLGLALTLALAGTQEWSVTLVLGVTLLAALIGWGLAELVGRLLAHAPDVAHAGAASES